MNRWTEEHSDTVQRCLKLSDVCVSVSECETKSVIKMAAAGTGSHEVLTVLLADGKGIMQNAGIHYGPPPLFFFFFFRVVEWRSASLATFIRIAAVIIVGTASHLGSNVFLLQ